MAQLALKKQPKKRRLDVAKTRRESASISCVAVCVCHVINKASMTCGESVREVVSNLFSVLVGKGKPGCLCPEEIKDELKTYYCVT